MRDIELLKQRVGSAGRHLAATEQARDRESEALMEMWRQIRGRFAEQDNEIARYRAQVEQLVDANENLGRMVDELVATIEGSVDRGRDKTVPRITSLAEELLSTEPDPLAMTGPGAETTPPRRAEDDLDTIAAADDDHGFGEPDSRDENREGFGFGDDAAAPEAEGSTVADEREADEESLSPGIRNLISRIEAVNNGALNGVSGDAEEDAEPTADDADDELTRELREIETLRTELSGLRERISASGG